MGETLDIQEDSVEVVEEIYGLGAVVLDLEDAVGRAAEVGRVGGLEVVVDCCQGHPHGLEHPRHVNEVGSIVVVELLGLGVGVQLVE